MSKTILTQKYLKEILNYNPDTGEFTWLIKKAGITRKVAGSISSGRYRTIMIDSKNYPCHRLAWLYSYGSFPPQQVDHINRNRLDNRLCNLRAVTNQENQMNRGFFKNSSGFKGVYWDKDRGKWAPKIKVDQVVINLGRFDYIEEAISMRLTAEDHYGFTMLI